MSEQFNRCNKCCQSYSLDVRERMQLVGGAGATSEFPGHVFEFRQCACDGTVTFLVPVVPTRWGDLFKRWESEVLAEQAAVKERQHATAELCYACMSREVRVEIAKARYARIVRSRDTPGVMGVHGPRDCTKCGQPRTPLPNADLTLDMAPVGVPDAPGPTAADLRVVLEFLQREAAWWRAASKKHGRGLCVSCTTAADDADAYDRAARRIEEDLAGKKRAAEQPCITGPTCAPGHPG